MCDACCAHAMRVSCVVDCYNAVVTEHDRWSVMYAEAVSPQAVLNLYDTLDCKCKLCHEIVLLLFSGNRLMYILRVLYVDTWQNGTKFRDSLKVLWCCSHLVWLVFEGFIPIHTSFHSENFL